MPMRCPKCDYCIENLRSNRCPECGKAFDPLLQETYRQGDRNWCRFIPPMWMRVTMLLSVLLSLPVIIPQFTSAQEGNDRRSPLSMLQSVRSQLELFHNQHGRRATLAELQNNWQIFITPHTGHNGEKLGPYFQQPPKNVLNGSSSVAAPNYATLHDGWVYDEKTGTLWATSDKWTAKEKYFDTEHDIIVVE